MHALPTLLLCFVSGTTTVSRAPLPGGNCIPHKHIHTLDDIHNKYSMTQDIPDSDYFLVYGNNGELYIMDKSNPEPGTAPILHGDTDMPMPQH